MKRKVGIDCPKCAVAENNHYYSGRIGVVKVFATGSVYDIWYDKDNQAIENCKLCNGLGLIYSYESLSLFQTVLRWIIK